jgi:hypothetical protein
MHHKQLVLLFEKGEIKNTREIEKTSNKLAGTTWSVCIRLSRVVYRRTRESYQKFKFLLRAMKND